MHDKQRINQQYEVQPSVIDVAEIGGIAIRESVELRQDMETDVFDLTQPESRVYSPYENFRFLVHVPLNGVDNRAAEIGSDRNGVLMTSLVSNTRVATFEGQGGIIVAQPDQIIGSTSHDNGDEIRGGTKVSVDELLRPQGNGDYNQIDMRFNATQPIGVVIKRAASDGRELGSERINESLKTYAIRNSLPIAEIIVLPDENMPSELASTVVPTADNAEMVTLAIPGSTEHYFRAQVLRGDAYHVSSGEAMAARVMKLSAYGETIRELSSEEAQDVKDALATLFERGDITKADREALERELA